MSWKLCAILLFVVAFLLLGCVGEPSAPPNTDVSPTPELNIFGRLIDLTVDGNFAQYTIDAEFAEFDANNTILEINGPAPTEELEKGQAYAFYFKKKTLHSTNWDGLEIGSFEGYQNKGSTKHEYDLVLEVKQLIPSGSAQELVTPILMEDRNEQVEFHVLNGKYYPIDYNLSFILYRFYPLHEVGGPTGERTPAQQCGLGLTEYAGQVTTKESISIPISCQNILSEMKSSEVFADYAISYTLTFQDILGNTHSRSPDEFNTLDFSVRPKPRCAAPDDQNYYFYENLGLGEPGWNEKTITYYTEGLVLDSTKADFTDLNADQRELAMDNPEGHFLNAKIKFDGELPQEGKRVQVYGVLSQGNFSATKWCYLE